jgi:hypothetical protein
VELALPKYSQGIRSFDNFGTETKTPIAVNPAL